MRTAIYNALKTLDSHVYFGAAPKMDTWNYIVFMREPTEFNESRRSKAKGFAVAVVREGFVSEDYDETVIAKMTAIPGVKLSGSVEYEYVRKPDTDVSCEVMILHFSKSIKR